MPTGDVEVVAEEGEVLSASAPLPFPMEGDQTSTVDEVVRLKYRYLDLRRPAPGPAMRLRARSTTRPRGAARARLRRGRDPTLTRSTPRARATSWSGPAVARAWYALPQSPQLFKQLLMVAGLERYYQIARCYRDEDFRADRQPEFTQLDIEMSFVDQDDVIELAEEPAALWSSSGRRAAAVPADDLRRGDGPVRLRQAGPAVRIELVE